MSIGKDFSKEKFLSLKVADLPELCYVYVESTHEIAIVKKGEVGYFPSVIDTSNMSKEDCIAYVDEQNELLEVSPEEAEMMSLKSMFGWVDGKKEEVHNEEPLDEAKTTKTVNIIRPYKLEIVDKEDLPAGYELTQEQELDAIDQFQRYLEKTLSEDKEWLQFKGIQLKFNYIEIDDHLKVSFSADTHFTEAKVKEYGDKLVDSFTDNTKPVHVTGIEGESEPCLVDLVILPKLEETLTEDLEDEEEPEESYDDTDSAFNELVKELVETNDLYKRVVEEIIEDADGYSGATLRERVLGRLQDILNGGLSNGSVSSLIYYSDTCAFFDDYEDEIYDFIEYMVDNSVDPLDVIKSHCSTAEILTQTDTVKNWVVWMVYEEIAYIFDAKIYDISEE